MWFYQTTVTLCIFILSVEIKVQNSLTDWVGLGNWWNFLSEVSVTQKTKSCINHLLCCSWLYCFSAFWAWKCSLLGFQPQTENITLGHCIYKTREKREIFRKSVCFCAPMAINILSSHWPGSAWSRTKAHRGKPRGRGFSYHFLLSCCLNQSLCRYA